MYWTHQTEAACLRWAAAAAPAWQAAYSCGCRASGAGLLAIACAAAGMIREAQSDQGPWGAHQGLPCGPPAQVASTEQQAGDQRRVANAP